MRFLTGHQLGIERIMLSRIAYSLLFPPNLLVALAVLSFLLALMLRWRWAAVLLTTFGLLWVVGWSLPITSLQAGRYLEQRHPHKEPSQYPRVDAIVVLGGHVQGNRSNWFEAYDKQNVISRESMAAALYFADRAPLILLSGGALEGNVSDTANMARSLRQLGIPAGAIVQETRSQNTLENAELTDRTLQRLKKQTILLVTSALHMPRAVAAFENTGVAVLPAPLPAQIRWPRTTNRSAWLPDLHTLMASSSIIKEYAGLVFYWLQDMQH